MGRAAFVAELLLRRFSSLGRPLACFRSLEKTWPLGWGLGGQGAARREAGVAADDAGIVRDSQSGLASLLPPRFP